MKAITYSRNRDRIKSAAHRVDILQGGITVRYELADLYTVEERFSPQQIELASYIRGRIAVQSEVD